MRMQTFYRSLLCLKHGSHTPIVSLVTRSGFENILKYRYQNITKSSCYISTHQCSSYSKIDLLNHTRKAYYGSSSNLKLHNCGDLCKDDVSREVRLRGFLQYKRLGLFCILRDYSGLIQILIDNDEFASILKETTHESYIEVVGDVALRPKEQVNRKLKTGEIEVVAKEFVVLNQAKKDLPFLIRSHNKPTEMLGLTYRYLDLRHQYLQENIRFRSRLGKKIRDYLQDVENFIEINTPTLSVNTPGGSQEFVVPTQNPGKYYSLVQSPQTYKQLAVIGGFEKYFQFAVCYRDETGRSDRQPEFMQLDIEMANVNSDDVRNITEELIVRSWPDEGNLPQTPFPSMSYDDAMKFYGVDKPDTRFQWRISDVSHIISRSDSQLFSGQIQSGNVAKAFVIPEGEKYLTKKNHREWQQIAKHEAHLPGVIILDVTTATNLKGKAAKAFSEELSAALIQNVEAKQGDTIVLSFGAVSKVLKLLGKLRLLGAEALEKAGVAVRDEKAFEFLWVVDFPMFEEDEKTKSLSSCHHPFTAPHPDHQHLLFEDPLQALSQHYDLVLNGTEIAGGSIRIHNAQLQREVLKILNIDSTSLNYLLEALDCGAPPHGGIALGFDRYVCVLRGAKSLREIMAFPKSSEGKCVMSGAPADVSEKERTLYHLRK